MKTRKINKVLLSFMLFASMLILSLSMLLRLNYTGVLAYEEEYNSEYYANIEISMAIIGDVLSNYRTENAVYSDYFAGVWYCYQGKLNIGITCETKVQSGHAYVIYHIRQHSHNFLLNIHNTVANLMSNFSIFEVALKPQYNQVLINLTYYNDIKSIREHLMLLSLYEEIAVNFIVDEMPVPVSAPIHAGKRIYRPIGRRGTISAKAICNITGLRGIITNAHVARSGELMRYATNDGSIIGIAHPTQRLEGGYGDVAFVPFYNQNYWEFTSSAMTFDHPNPSAENPTYYDNPPLGDWYRFSTHQIACQNQIQVGLRVSQFGATTGWTEGQVVAINSSLRMYVDDVPWYFHNQFRHSARVFSGDSGGPVLARIGNVGNILIGTNFSSGGASSKIINITRELDVTIMAYSQLNYDILHDGNIEITGINFSHGRNFSIPNEIVDINVPIGSIPIRRPVTRIGSSAFANQSAITTITIPDTIIYISNSAFHTNTTTVWQGIKFRNYNILGIQGDSDTISIPNKIAGRTITAISANAFSGNTTLHNIIIPSGIVYIGVNAFANTSPQLRIFVHEARGWAEIEGSFLNRHPTQYYRCADTNLQRLSWDWNPQRRSIMFYSPVVPWGIPLCECCSNDWVFGLNGQPAIWSFQARFLNMQTSQRVIPFVTQGGSNIAPINAYVGQPIGALPAPTRAGFRFDGWWSESDGGAKITSSTIVCDSFTAGLHARWIPFSGGDGHRDNPYQIASDTDLRLLANLVNSGESFYGVYFVLTNDINLGGVSWTPIGTEDSPFQGVFNGRGFVISGMFIEGDFYAAGLFGVVDGGQVRNVGVVESVAVGDSMYTGGIAGVLRNGGAVVNSYFRGVVDGGDYTGGLVGWIDNGVMFNNFFYGTVNGSREAGGIAGRTSGWNIIDFNYVYWGADIEFFGEMGSYNGYGARSRFFDGNGTLVNRVGNRHLLRINTQFLIELNVVLNWMVIELVYMGSPQWGDLHLLSYGGFYRWNLCEMVPTHFLECWCI